MLVSVISQLLSRNNILWIDSFVHSLVESYCAIIAFIISYVVYREYKSSGKRSNLYLFLAFFSMGTFDFFHAYSNHCVTLFVWFHSLSAFSGGTFFLWSAVSMRNDAKDPPWQRRLFAVFGMAATVASAVILSEYFSFLPNAVVLDISHHTPVTLPIRGEFTGYLLGVNLFSALAFLAAALYYLKYFNSGSDVLYHIFSFSAFLFFESEGLFVFSRLWDPAWWYWHIIKLLIYLGLVIGLVHGLARTFSELRESRRKLTRTVEELRHAYDNLRGTQEELLEAEKLASIGKMAALISHEIRNPLGAISNSIGIFKRHTRLAGEDKELLSIVENEISRLNGIITDFLNYAKPSPMNKSLVDINQLLEETLLFFREDGPGSPAVRVSKQFDPNLPLVAVDRNAFKQCLWNVLINAVQAMPSGGALTITTGCSGGAGNGGPCEEVTVLIADSGCGMSGDTLSRAFHPFYSTKAKGTGLGLATVKKIIGQHGGAVSLSSTAGKGTQVAITIPADHRTNPVDGGDQHVVHTDSR